MNGFNDKLAPDTIILVGWGGVGEGAELEVELRAVVALLEDPGSVPSLYMVVYNCP